MYSLTLHVSDLAFFPVDTDTADGPLTFGSVSSILLLKTDSAVTPVSLASPGILVL